MTTLAPSFAAISRVVFQPWSVRTTVSVFCFKSAISASCFPGFDLQQIDQNNGLVGHGISPSVSDTPRTTRRVETDRDVEDFLENHLEGVCIAEVCNANCNNLTLPERNPSRVNRKGFPNQCGSDSDCLPVLEVRQGCRRRYRWICGERVLAAI